MIPASLRVDITPLVTTVDTRLRMLRQRKVDETPFVEEIQSIVELARRIKGLQAEGVLLHQERLAHDVESAMYRDLSISVQQKISERNCSIERLQVSILTFLQHSSQKGKP